MKKNAQAALEFLTTYGWAFLIILILIAALAYFGILNPSKFLPNRCSFGAEFQCIDYQLAGGAANTLRLKVKNSMGDAITLQSVTFSSESATSFTCTAVSPASYPWAETWKAGNTSDFSWGTCNYAAAGFSQGDKAKVLITIRYYDITSGVNYAKEVKGEIYSSVI